MANGSVRAIEFVSFTESTMSVEPSPTLKPNPEGILVVRYSVIVMGESADEKPGPYRPKP
jgi:hypothetical protein